MKVCLNANQDAAYIKKADMLYLQYEYKDNLEKLVEAQYDKEIIFQWLFDGENFELDLALILHVCELSKYRLIIEVESIDEIKILKEKNPKIKCYINREVKTFFELNALIKLNVEYVILGAPLFFQMNEVKRKGVKILAYPNIAFNDGFYREDGAHGTWISPDGLHKYNSYINVIKFVATDKNQEQALYRIYCENKTWPGEVSLIVHNFLNKKCSNILLPPNFTKFRLNCGQKCEINGRCKLCDNFIKYANPERLQTYLDNTINS